MKGLVIYVNLPPLQKARDLRASGRFSRRSKNAVEIRFEIRRQTLNGF